MYLRIAKCLGCRRCGLPIFDRLTQRCDQSARQTIELRLEDKLRRVHPFITAFDFQHKNTTVGTFNVRVDGISATTVTRRSPFVSVHTRTCAWLAIANSSFMMTLDPDGIEARGIGTAAPTRRRRQRLQRLQFFKKWRQEVRNNKAKESDCSGTMTTYWLLSGCFRWRDDSTLLAWRLRDHRWWWW